MDSSFDLDTLFSNHKMQFKTKPMEFVNLNSGGQKRLENSIKDRKKTRSVAFDILRNIPKYDSPVKLSEEEQKLEDRMQKLEKWKKEKIKRKKEQEKNKKKPFVAGVVHVPFKFELPPFIKPVKPAKPSISGCNTRTQTAQPILRKNKSKDLSKERKRNTRKLTNQPEPEEKESSETAMKSNSISKTSIAFVYEENLENPTTTYSTFKNEILMKSGASAENGATPMNSESKGDNVNTSSPCVTMAQGKDNAEIKKKMKEGLLEDDASDSDKVDYFRRQLASEIKRITEICEKWEKINEQTQLPDLTQEAILGAVGQARLLVSKKLAQFGTLVEQCAHPDPASALVTPSDLHGFWDMVSIQIDNINIRFIKLKRLKYQGLLHVEPKVISRKVVKPLVKESTKPIGGPSKLREVIAAARKAKKEQEEQKSPGPVTESDVINTFDAGFFYVQSPVRSPGTNPTTPSQKAKAVPSNEANKASASKQYTALAMMSASKLGKNIEYDGDTTLPQAPDLAANESQSSRGCTRKAKAGPKELSIRKKK